MATLLTGCGSEDECEVDFLLGNAIDYAYVWRDPSTECELSTTLPGNISFRTGTSRLEFHTDDPLTVGTHLAEVTYTSKEGITWSNYDYLGIGSGESSAVCVLTILSTERVDWVWEDHQRITGTVDCTTGYLTAQGQPDLSLSSVVFTVYAADDGFYL